MYVDDSEFRASLLLVKDWTDKAIVGGMQRAQVLVVKHAKDKHPRPPKFGHPYHRYYDREGHLTGSIRPGIVETYMDGIAGEVHAGGSIAGAIVNYAAGVELGTPTSRAYPFLKPALEEQKELLLGTLGIAIKGALAG